MNKNMTKYFCSSVAINTAYQALFSQVSDAASL